MDASPDPCLVGLYERAQICQIFPAYKLEELRAMPARELRFAMQLLNRAEEVRRAHNE